MARTKISEFSATPGNNTDIDGINIAEGCAPSGINDAIRELMAQLKDFQAGTAGDSFNGPVGTTTAAAGAFTTLSASGAVTLSGGTANGVPYLNGSKVLTTGSALTFDGTNLALGTGNIFTPTTSGIFFSSPGTFVNGVYGVGSNNVAFNANGSEQMRLTSTGLGIGTSSPVGRLRVKGSSNNFASGLSLQKSNSNATYEWVVGGDDALYLGYADNASGADAAADFTIRTVLDSSGNLGLGVTPSAWNGAFFKPLEGGDSNNQSYVGFRTDANTLNIGTNNFFNTSNQYVYKFNGAASRFDINADSFAWSLAPSGTAGNAISFTQAMTLDASGNLYLGGTGPLYSEKFRLVGNYAVFGNGTYTGLIGQGAAMGTGTASDFGIRSENALAFLAGGGTERARIDSSGNLLVGTTSNQANGRIQSMFDGASLHGMNVVDSSSAATSTAISFIKSSGQRGSITVTSSATAYNTSSDYRLKENIQPMTGALAKVAQLKPVTYKWKADGSDGEGFIAHELAEVCPQAVTGEKDAVDAEGNPVYQGIDTSFLVATLTAAIQELKAEFDAYKATHP